MQNGVLYRVISKVIKAPFPPPVVGVCSRTLALGCVMGGCRLVVRACATVRRVSVFDANYLGNYGRRGCLILVTYRKVARQNQWWRHWWHHVTRWRHSCDVKGWGSAHTRPRIVFRRRQKWWPRYILHRFSAYTQRRRVALRTCWLPATRLLLLLSAVSRWLPLLDAAASSIIFHRYVCDDELVCQQLHDRSACRLAVGFLCCSSILLALHRYIPGAAVCRQYVLSSAWLKV